MAPLQTFKLKSGATLQVQPPSFEKGVALMEAVGKSVFGMSPETEIQAVLFEPKVRAAIYEVFPWVLYETRRMSLDLFSDPDIGDRLGGDWFELAGKVVEVTKSYFFPRASSGSSLPGEAATSSQPQK